MMGYVVSGLVFSHYSDKYGRRPLTWLSMTIAITGILLSGVSVNIYMYGVSRFLVGMGITGFALSVKTTCNAILIKNLFFFIKFRQKSNRNIGTQISIRCYDIRKHWLGVRLCSGPGTGLLAPGFPFDAILFSHSSRFPIDLVLLLG